MEGQNLAVAFARELSELTGESPSCLYQWGKDLGLPVPRARQTFYSRLASDSWERSSAASSTENCRMGSYPLSCQLRLRVVSLLTQFSRDKKAATKRQLIVLLGYEACSHLLHFRVYRGPDYEGDVGIPVCGELPVATVAQFVEECGRMVGLPLQRVLFTQKLLDFAPPAPDDIGYLSLTLGKITWRKRNEAAAADEVLCSFAGALGQQLAKYPTLQGNHPFINWCGTTNATELTSLLSEWVKRHNKDTALPRLETARKALEALFQKSHEGIKKKFKPSPWEAPFTPFMNRISQHGYLASTFSLHEVRFYKRRYENFNSEPGDCPKAEL